jgi:hypothetical protein
MTIDGRPIESGTFSFVVRIWYEGTGSDRRSPVWRGSIEHVGDGQRRYFVNLDEIAHYITEHVGPLDSSEVYVTGNRPRPSTGVG